MCALLRDDTHVKSRPSDQNTHSPGTLRLRLLPAAAEVMANRSMSNYQIYSIAKAHHHTRAVFQCCLTKNSFPAHVKSFPAAYICNTLASRDTGAIGHWYVVLLLGPDRQAECFDPDPVDISEYGPQLRNFLATNSDGRYHFNRQVFQAAGSRQCGQFCLWFIDKRATNNSFQQCMNLLSTQNLKENGDYVSRYVASHMKPTY